MDNFIQFQNGKTYNQIFYTDLDPQLLQDMHEMFQCVGLYLDTMRTLEKSEFVRLCVLPGVETFFTIGENETCCILDLPDDISMLASHVIDELSRMIKFHEAVPSDSGIVLDIFYSRNWNQNIRWVTYMIGKEPFKVVPEDLFF
jgi:hypothetical protein